MIGTGRWATHNADANICNKRVLSHGSVQAAFHPYFRHSGCQRRPRYANESRQSANGSIWAVSRQSASGSASEGSRHSADDPIADVPIILSITGMRRQKLVWFAAGVACSSVAAVGAALALRSPPNEQGWFLRVAERGQSLRDGQTSAVWRGAEIARDCGAQSFETIPSVSPDRADATRIPLMSDNNPSLGCVVERARDAGLWVGVQLEPLRAGG